MNSELEDYKLGYVIGYKQGQLDTKPNFLLSILASCTGSLLALLLVLISLAFYKG